MSPLKPGKSQETISSNIKELHGGKVHAATAAKSGKASADRQSVAIAEKTAREGKKK